MNKQITIKVTVNKVEREVVFTEVFSNYTSGAIFAAQIGKGKKLHAAEINLIKFESAEQAKKSGWNIEKACYVDENNNYYFFNMNTTVRNARAYIVDWADLHFGSEQATKQNYYGSLKVGA